ncbi:hypothetical protein F4677DRAFT_334235 [Hypoxylon crocopeplum]|nr:hypothetical protein F4677DRAFT_334235 [Hypoxylon crocopeplum]
MFRQPHVEDLAGQDGVGNDGGPPGGIGGGPPGGNGGRLPDGMGARPELRQGLAPYVRERIARYIVDRVAPYVEGPMMPYGEGAAVPGVQGPVMPGFQGPVMPGFQGPMMPGFQGPVMPGIQEPAEQYRELRFAEIINLWLIRKMEEPFIVFFLTKAYLTILWMILGEYWTMNFGMFLIFARNLVQAYRDIRPVLAELLTRDRMMDLATNLRHNSAIFLRLLVQAADRQTFAAVQIALDMTALVMQAIFWMLWVYVLFEGSPGTDLAPQSMPLSWKAADNISQYFDSARVTNKVRWRYTVDGKYARIMDWNSD